MTEHETPSEPKRYALYPGSTLFQLGDKVPPPTLHKGEFVRYEDYVSLQEEKKALLIAKFNNLESLLAKVQNEALEHAASIVENVAHSCTTEQHCDFLHAAHNRAAANIRALKSKS